MAAAEMSVNARTGARRRAETKQELLDATVRLLAGGASLATLSVEKIVTEAGVVRTTFYLHFKDKNDLISCLADEQVRWIEQIGLGAEADPDLSLATIERVVEEIVSNWAAHRAELAAIIELAEYDPMMREKWLAAMRHVAAAAARLFASHWRATGLAPRHPDRTAEDLTWMIERCCHQVARDETDEREVVESLTDIIWRVLHPKPVGD